MSKEGPARGTAHVRNASGNYRIGDCLVSSTDWGVKGHVFYTYDAGAWVKLVDGAEVHLEVSHSDRTRSGVAFVSQWH